MENANKFAVKYKRTRALRISQLISKLKHKDYLNNRNLSVLNISKNAYRMMI